MSNSAVILSGSLSVMSFADLMQWAHAAKKTGRFDFVLEHAHRRIYLQEGKIIACTADDPPLLLGQFLISHGQITETQLSDAMRLQEITGKPLGQIFQELDIMTKELMQRCVLAKAEETIYGLFEWHEATFSFTPDAAPEKAAMWIDLEIPTALLEGAKRLDELNDIRQVFSDSRIVLSKTDEKPDEHLTANFMARSLYDAVDGRRTLRSIILESHAPKFLACSFLLRLHERGFVQIAGVDDSPCEKPTPRASIERVRDLVNHDEYATAIEMIDVLRSEVPLSGYWKLLVARAESGYIAQMYRNDVPPDAIPRLALPDRADADDSLSDSERFLLEQIDDEWNVRSLVWITPLRKIDVVRGIRSLLDKGYIELQQPEHAGAQTSKPAETPSLTSVGTR